MDDPGICLWTLRRGEREVSCIVRLAAYGVEVDIAYDGSPVITRVFETGDEAQEWSEQTRAQRRSRGWKDGAPPATQDDYT